MGKHNGIPQGLSDRCPENNARTTLNFTFASGAFIIMGMTILFFQ